MAKGMGGTGKKRCTKGKSCGATCISKGKVCIMETGGGISSGLGKLSSEIPKFKGGGGLG